MRELLDGDLLVVPNVENGAFVTLASYKVESLKRNLGKRFKAEKLIVSEEQTQFEFEAPLQDQEKTSSPSF